jgi:hypothetical protein
MTRGLFDVLLDKLKGRADAVADKRREGHNRKYLIRDALLSAFAVFFMGHPSLLSFAREMHKKKKRDNVQAIFGAFKIPSDPQIRDIADRVEPKELAPVFWNCLREAGKAGLLDSYKVLEGGVLLAMDGVWYFSSSEVSCKHCLHITKDGVTTYYHSALAGTLVKPGSNDVIPVAPEMIRNGDVESEEESYEKQKQDCEMKALIRWLDEHGKEYAWLSPTFLGDDLYSKYPICRKEDRRNRLLVFVYVQAANPCLDDGMQG